MPPAPSPRNPPYAGREPQAVKNAPGKVVTAMSDGPRMPSANGCSRHFSPGSPTSSVGGSPRPNSGKPWNRGSTGPLHRPRGCRSRRYTRWSRRRPFRSTRPSTRRTYATYFRGNPRGVPACHVGGRGSAPSSPPSFQSITLDLCDDLCGQLAFASRSSACGRFKSANTLPDLGVNPLFGIFLSSFPRQLARKLKRRRIRSFGRREERKPLPRVVRRIPHDTYRPDRPRAPAVSAKPCNIFALSCF